MPSASKWASPRRSRSSEQVGGVRDAPAPVKRRFAGRSRQIREVQSGVAASYLGSPVAVTAGSKPTASAFQSLGRHGHVLSCAPPGHYRLVRPALPTGCASLRPWPSAFALSGRVLDRPTECVLAGVKQRWPGETPPGAGQPRRPPAGVSHPWRVKARGTDCADRPDAATAAPIRGSRTGVQNGDAASCLGTPVAVPAA